MARSKKSYIKWYKHELERAKSFRQQHQYDALWERMVDLYRGKTLPTVQTKEDRVVVNVAFGTINVIYPSVSVNYPKITVMPNDPLDEDRAVLTEVITNFNWKHFNFQDQFRLAVKDYLLIGHGWVKCGYRYKEEDAPYEEEERTEMFDQSVEQADSFAAENPGMAGDVPDNDEILAALPEAKIVIAEDQPFIERVSPFDIFVDPEATGMDDARWICQRIIRPIEDVRKDKRYKQSVRLSVQSDMHADQFREQQRRMMLRGNQDPEDQRVTIYEWYDIKRNTMAVCAEGSEQFLVDPAPCPFPFGQPFVMIRNYDVPDYFYPMGDLEAIEPLVNELNKTRSIGIQVRQKFARKTLARAGAFDAQGRQALESNVDNTVVFVADEGADLNQVVAAMPQIPVPPELFEHSDTIEKDIGDVSGISEYQRGQVPETRRTATEASIIQDNVSARSAEKLAQIEKAIARIARRVIQLQQEFMQSTQVARIVGPDQAIYWIPYDHEDIKGEFDFEVEAGSTQPQNDTVRRQTATALMEAMQPFIDMGVVDPARMAEHVLREGFGVKDPSKFIMMPEIDPMTGMPMEPGMEGQMGGVGGPQGPPDGAGGFTNDQGEVGNQLPMGAMMG